MNIRKICIDNIFLLKTEHLQVGQKYVAVIMIKSRSKKITR